MTITLVTRSSESLTAGQLVMVPVPGAQYLPAAVVHVPVQPSVDDEAPVMVPYLPCACPQAVHS